MVNRLGLEPRTTGLKDRKRGVDKCIEGNALGEPSKVGRNEIGSKPPESCNDAGVVDADALGALAALLPVLASLTGEQREALAALLRLTSG
jgi:hypothetical protein